MKEQQEPTIEEIRREIAQNEAETVKETSKILNALCVAVAFLPLVRIYLDRAEPNPISDTPSLSTVSKSIDSIITGRSLPAINKVVQKNALNSWTLGERLCFASLDGKVPEDVLKSLKDEGAFAHRDQAAAAFIDRKIKGLNLSDRVWRLGPGIKAQIETVLQISILDGRSAIDTANDLKKYLKNPDALFKKVRDQGGKLQLSKAAKNYNPGRGVYRSAFMNAHRLARTEINAAYRRADWEQMQALDFVTGYRIQLSKNHPVKDICDILQGTYPKAFKWSGWHPGCRCHMIKEVVSLDQLARMQRGEFTPVQTTKFPEEMRAWVKENKHRFKSGPGTLTGVEWVDNSPELLEML